MKIALGLVIMIFVSASALAQAAPKSRNAVAPPNTQAARSSPAFAEVVLRKAELEAEIEALLLDFTDDYPKVKAARYGFDQLQKQGMALLAVGPDGTSKLTLALGKLIVKKVELDMELWTLRQTLADGHPDVKRAKKKVDIFEKAIREILG